MAEQRNRWNWEVSGFEPRKSSASVEPEEHRVAAPLVRRKMWGSHINCSHGGVAKEDYLELRQEASDLQDYSNAKLDRVTRYLGVLAEKTRKLDQVALETEARISPLINEKKRLFNDLLTAKVIWSNYNFNFRKHKVFCRARPLFEDEGPSIVEFPDDCTIRVNTGDDSIANPKKDFEFDRIFGPHVGQDSDLLSESESSLQKICMGSAESFIELVQEKVDNPLDFSRVLKAAFQSRGNDTSKFNVSHLIITIHIYYHNLISGENLYSKLSLVDLAGSDGLITEDDSGERVTDLLHVMKSLSALGDVLSSLTSRKDVIPYENSMLTTLLADP
ncbi:hypothetical protein GH714_017111 [Hevea brasiliensis]|uniref:Kinesin motor domain-containing protein n=1 Tax=Hevea brasiliensis TaxID=3981 RepID=A0A6A6K5E3_HEVBR|nr:hypothetical protein GH714_017111 [Hevea brasiliensis]